MSNQSYQTQSSPIISPRGFYYSSILKYNRNSSLFMSMQNSLCLRKVIILFHVFIHTMRYRPLFPVFPLCCIKLRIFTPPRLSWPPSIFTFQQTFPTPTFILTPTLNMDSRVTSLRILAPYLTYFCKWGSLYISKSSFFKVPFSSF